MSQPPPQAQSHVRALDHVRALSAFAVVIHHVEQAKAILGLPGVWLTPWVQSLGTAGVDVFFGLSGYVITQSLLRDGLRPAGELLRRFYGRRGLRILPLYLAVVIVAFGPLPWLMAGVDSQVGAVLDPALRARDEHYDVLLLLHLLGLPNAALVAYPGVPFATHLWSVGAEMQFYLAWPLFFLLTRQVWTAAAAAVVVTALVDVILRNPGLLGVAPWSGADLARQTLGMICAAAFVSGPGARMFARPAPLRVLHWPALTLIVGLLTSRHLLPATEWVSPALLAAALAGLVAARQGAATRTSFADHLGRISYSVYAWHVLVIGVVALAVDVTIGLQPWGAAPHLALYGGVVLITTLVATVSFRVIERPFLRLTARR